MKPVPDPVTPARRPQVCVESPSPRRNASRDASGGRVPGSEPTTPRTPARTRGTPARTTGTPTRTTGTPARTTATIPSSLSPSLRRNGPRGTSGGRVPGSEPTTPGMSVSPHQSGSRQMSFPEDSFTVPVTPVRSRKRVLAQEESSSEDEDLPDPERPRSKQRVKRTKPNKPKAKEVMDDEEIKLAKANERNNAFYKQQMKEDGEFNQKMKIVIVNEEAIYRCQHKDCVQEFVVQDKYRARSHVLSHRVKKRGLRGISSLNMKKCLKCNLMFPSKEIHKHYQNIHAVYKAVCGECEKEFANERQLNQHEKVHNKLKCTYCTREFAIKSILNKHIKSVHGAKTVVDINKELESVISWTDKEVNHWMEKVESQEQDVKEEIVKKLISVKHFNEALWLKYIEVMEGQAGEKDIVKEALEALPFSLSLWLVKIRLDPSKETLELAMTKVGDLWGSSEIWDTLLQLHKDEEDFHSLANLYQHVLAIPSPNLEHYKDEALVLMSNLCETSTERDTAVETIEELFEATNTKKEQLQEFEDLLAADSRDLSVWKAYVDKVKLIYEGEEGEAGAVVNLAFRASVSCGEQEDLWFWLVELGVQHDFSRPCTVCPTSVRLNLAWAEVEEKEGRLEEARLIILNIFNATRDYDLVVKMADLEVRQGHIVKAVDILEETLETELSDTETEKLATRLAMLLAVNGEASKALVVVTDAISNSKCNADLLKLKIDVLKINGDYNEIINVCEHALTVVKESKKLYFATTLDLFCSILGINIEVKKKAESCVKKSSSIGEVGKYPCEQCDKVFSIKYSREKHVVCDHAVEEMSCRKCFVEFNSVFELKKHSKMCKEPYKCECGYSHRRKYYFNKHECK